MANSLAHKPPVAGRFRHIGFFYRSGDEYAAAVGSFLRDGIAADEPCFAAISTRNTTFIKDALGADASVIEFADMAATGRRPAELREATKHEALINLAFAAADADVLCPYNTAALDAAVIADASQTHPLLLSGGRCQESPGYAVPSLIPSSRSLPLPAPPHDAMSLTYRTNLSEVRALVFKRAVDAGLTEARANDLVLAVSEVAANTLRHTRSDGTLNIWHDQNEIVCEVHDEGTITDPLAGRRVPAPDASGGHGLWLVHQVCDLVELRSDASGTTVRMHMAIRPAAATG